MRRARQVVLLTDYDGTLTPIVASPEQAKLPPAVRDILGRLSELPGVVVGVISGRSLNEVKRLVGLPGVVYVGNHGLELQGPGISFTHPIGRRFHPVLQRLARELTQALRGVPGAWVEWKGMTLSVHWRQVPVGWQRRFATLIDRRLASALTEGTIRVTKGKRVIEVRPPVNWDKGQVIDWLVRRLPPLRRRAPPVVIYLGDDRTDQDAFRVVNRLQGLSIFVGRPAGRNVARYRLRNPHDVLRWLELLEQIVKQRVDHRRRVHGLGAGVA